MGGWMLKTVLTIAGSDSGGGAGIQADIKTMTVHGVYAASAVTAVTAQNTTGVYGVQKISPDFLRKQIDCVFQDITPDAVKTGMLPGKEHVETVAEVLSFYRAKHIVTDPVMVSTSGTSLMDEAAKEALKEKLFPLAELITPNIPETEELLGRHVRTKEDMESAAEELHKRWGCAVLCKGGHFPGEADDFLYTEKGGFWIPGERIPSENTHGTGCTLSSAIACRLARGESLKEAVSGAKKYLAGALQAGLNLGKGNGPLNHMYETGGRI